MAARPPKNLTALRKWLAKFRANAQSSGDPGMLAAEYEFRYKGPDQEEETEITEEDFNAAPGGGGEHPRVGVYIVSVWSSPEGDDEQRVELHREEGRYSGNDLSFDDKANDGEGMGGALKAIGASYRQNLSDLHAELARARRNTQQAEAREDAMRTKLEASADARDKKNQELLAALVARDEAVFQRGKAEEESKALREEMRVMRERGEELGIAAKAAMSSLFDRGMEQMGQVPMAQEREVVTDAAIGLTEGLIDRANLHILFQLCRRGIVAWEDARVAIAAEYDVDPGARVPADDWQPPFPEPDEEEESPQEEIH